MDAPVVDRHEDGLVGALRIVLHSDLGTKRGPTGTVEVEWLRDAEDVQADGDLPVRGSNARYVMSAPRQKQWESQLSASILAH